MTQPLYPVRHVLSLRPGQIVRSYAGRAYALAAIDRQALDRAACVLVGLSDPSRIEVRTIFDADLDRGTVEVFEGEHVITVLDGLPALGVDQDGREFPGTLSVQGGVVRWLSERGTARLTLRSDGTWYAPGFDLAIFPGEMA